MAFDNNVVANNDWINVIDATSVIVTNAAVAFVFVYVVVTVAIHVVTDIAVAINVINVAMLLYSHYFINDTADVENNLLSLLLGSWMLMLWLIIYLLVLLLLF